MKKKLFLIVGFLILITSFQNCMSPSFFGTSKSRLPITQNGTGYGGIKDGVTFYKRASDVTYAFPLTVTDVDHYTITPTLPAGLSLDSQTGIISGTPVDVTSDYFPYDFVAVQKNGQKVSVKSLIGVGYVYYVSANVDGFGNPDANLADHLCADSSGVCSLQAALDQSGANLVKTRIILPGKTYLSSSDGLNLSSSVELLGVGIGVTVFDGQNINRVIKATAMDVTIRNLTVSHGYVSVPTDFGAGINYVNISGKLELQNVELAYNTSATTTNGGGGLYFLGTNLLVQNSHIHHNISANMGGGSNAGGGGLYFYEGNVLVKDSVIEDNSTGWSGGAVYSYFANPTFDNVVFARNTAGDQGGAFYSFPGNGATFRKSVFMDNQVTTSGQFFLGGAISWTPNILGDLIIENSTFVRNRASYGGAISMGWPPCDPIYKIIIVRNSTFAGNTATTIGGGDAIHLMDYCTVKMVNSVIGVNGTQSCSLAGYSVPGIINSLGSNIDSANSCALNGSNDLINTDPLLGPLTQYGSTYLYPLLPGSPAIDSGDNSQCLPDDQRGVSRPQGAGCDRGAFEL